MKHDSYIRGILPDIPYRYVVATAFDSVHEIWNRHSMAAGTAILVGEAAVAAFLLAARGTKEVDQTVGLHFECEGPVRRLMASGRFDGGLRGYSPEPRIEWSGSLMDGKASGTLNVSLFRDRARKVYASSVPFRNQPIARNIEEFLARSEQQQVFVELGPFSEDGAVESFYPGPISLQQAGIYGSLFEALPEATADDTDRLLDFLKDTSFVEALRHNGRLPELPGKLAEGSLFHYCECSREKVEAVIAAMGKREAEALLAEQGKIEITCEFCCEKYQFGQSDLERIFVEGSV